MAGSAFSLGPDDPGSISDFSALPGRIHITTIIEEGVHYHIS